MYALPITFLNLDGEEVTEVHHFQITRAELVELEVSKGKSFKDYLLAIVAAESHKQMVEEFKALIRLSYGRREENRFVKDPAYFTEFEQTGAYDGLFMRMMTEEDFSAEFVRGIMPKQNVNAPQAGTTTSQLPSEDTRPAWEREDRMPTKAEQQSMSKDELIRAFQARSQS